jgi:hypothetical protein
MERVELRQAGDDKKCHREGAGYLAHDIKQERPAVQDWLPDSHGLTGRYHFQECPFRACGPRNESRPLRVFNGLARVFDPEAGVFNYGPLPYDKEFVVPESSSGSMPPAPT